jgi:hypothetical protein
MSSEEQEFWERLRGSEARFRRQDYHGRAVASALALRRESDDLFADLTEYAEYATDTDDAEGYVAWLQKAESDVQARIDEATTSSMSDDAAEVHLSFAYSILREVCLDALTRRPPG